MDTATAWLASLNTTDMSTLRLLPTRDALTVQCPGCAAAQSEAGGLRAAPRRPAGADFADYVMLVGAAAEQSGAQRAHASARAARLKQRARGVGAPTRRRR